MNGVADGVVVYQPSRDRIHFLNHSAAVVFEFCTGSSTADEIGEAVQVAFDLPAVPTEEIENCFAELREQGLIE